MNFRLQKPILKNLKTIQKNTLEKILKNRVRIHFRYSLKTNDVSLDSATRRRAACDFLQALCIFFESQVIALYSQYIDAMQKVK